MDKYEELINDLRRCAVTKSCVDCPKMQTGCTQESLLEKAADAIEEYRKYCWELQHCACYVPMRGKK